LASLSFVLAVLEHGWTHLSRTRLAETASGPASRSRLERMLAEGDRVEDALIVMRVSTQVALVMMLVVLFQQAMTEDGSSPDATPVLVAGGVAFLWITLFCRVLPAEMSARLLEGIVRRTMPVVVLAARVLAPPIALLRRLARTMTGHTPQAEAEMYADEILSTVEEGEREGHLGGEQADMIERVLELQHTEVRHLMTPRTDMDVIDVTSTLEQAREEVVSSRRSRYPLVEEGSVDRVVGILHVKDLVGKDAEAGVAQFARKPRFVPDTKFGSELLAEFRKDRTHLAIVLDEYGGTAGLVTIEDAIEEIVGEIDDEFDDADEENDELQVVDERHAVAAGAMHVDELNEALSISIPESDDWSTLGGFIFHTLGRLPETGESMQHENLTLRVEAVEDRRIERVAIAIGEAAV
jgi:CBS domain containing-hemolysin-like protein